MSDIKLFSFQEKEIRTTLVGRDVWFAAVDVFRVLNLQWRGGNSLSKRQIPAQWTRKEALSSLGGLQETIFVNEQALYKLAFRAQASSDADAFTSWVAELLVKIRKGSHIRFAATSDSDHMLIAVQKANSKAINAKMFLDGDVEAIKKHNTINCEVHTGRKPSEVKEIAKGLGLKSKERSSAKEALRHISPEIAASMSMADQLVGENNITSKVAAETCREYAVPLYKRLIEIGAHNPRTFAK